MQLFGIINNVGIAINADMNVKNWFIEVIIIKDLFGIQVNLNVNVIIMGCWRIFRPWKFQFRKKLVNKLVEECTGNIDDIKLAKITLAEHENKYENMCKCSCRLYTVLISVLLTANIEISTFFVYCKYEINC